MTTLAAEDVLGTKCFAYPKKQVTTSWKLSCSYMVLQEDLFSHLLYFLVMSMVTYT